MESNRAWNYEHVHDYLTIQRKAREALAAGKRVRLRWNDEPMDADAFMRDSLKALDRRINLKASREPSWRKLDPQYQTGLMRDQQRIQDRVNRRIRVYQFETKEIMARFGHLLSDRND